MFNTLLHESISVIFFIFLFRIFYYVILYKLNKEFFLKIFLVAYMATFLRSYLNNIFIVSILGSFLYGFVIPRRISKLNQEILLSGFCSCFTSFSGFVDFSYQFIMKGYYIKLFLYLNLTVVLNLIIMYLGFLLSRKMT